MTGDPGDTVDPGDTDDPGDTIVRPAAGLTRSGLPREVGPDVVRALALAGVVVMNYHGYLNGGDAAAGAGSGLAVRWFDPFQGVLATRFAATFVLVAGMGITLLTRRGVSTGDRDTVAADRWRLVRRGLTLYGLGVLIEWIWPGTILFFYGAYFVIAAGLFTLTTRWLVAIGATSAVAAAGIHLWSAWRIYSGQSPGWLYPGELDSFRNLMLRTFIGYTHPVLPWLVFLCAGIVLGRLLPRFAEVRWRVAGWAGVALVGSYALSTVVWRLTDEPTVVGPDGAVNGFWRDEGWRLATSTRPMDRGLLYVVGTLGSSILAYCVISWWAQRRAEGPTVELLRRAGQMSLSIYLLHVFVFNAFVEWWGWVQPTGLGTALAFSLGFWAAALVFAAWWHRYLGPGPAERLYRNLGG